MRLGLCVNSSTLHNHTQSCDFLKMNLCVVSCALGRDLGGTAAPDNSWKGALNVSYNIGPGFIGSKYSR